MLGKNICATFSLTCESCIEDKKNHGVIFSNNWGGGEQATKCLEIVHSNICGSIKYISMKGSMNIGKNMETRLSGRNDTLMMVGEDESFKLSLFDLDKDIKEHED